MGSVSRWYIAGVILAHAAYLAAAPSVTKVKEAIAKNEQRLQNIRVDGSAFQEKWDGAKWKDFGHSTAIAWYTGLPGSKFRIDYRERVLPVGPADRSFIRMVYDVSYNGRVGMRLQLQDGDAHEKIGTIGLARGRADEPATGWAASIFGFDDNDGKCLSQLISQDAKVVDTRCNGLPVVGISQLARVKGAHETWYVDAMRGYALVGYARTLESGITERRLEVTDLREVLPGVFYPKTGTWTYFDWKTGAKVHRLRIEISHVVANDPKFNDDVFGISFPKGTLVEDEIAGTSYEVGASDREVLATIRSQALAAKQAATTESSVPGEVVTRQNPTTVNSVAETDGERARHVSVGVVLMIVLAVAMVLGVVTLVLYRRSSAPGGNQDGKSA